jgi:hypothetical protein
MKGIKSDEIRLRQIPEAVFLIEKFSPEKQKDGLYNDSMYRFSIKRQLGIIGETANNPSPSLLEKNRDEPWSQVISFLSFPFLNISGWALSFSGLFGLFICLLKKALVEKILNEIIY